MSNFIDYHGKRIGTSSSKQLIEKSYLEYMALPSADKLDPTKEYFVDDASELSGLIIDSVVSETDTWSSQKINNLVNNVAPIEPSTTASQAYSKDDQFIFEGQLVKATTDITAETQIVVGNEGNCVVANSIGEQLTAINTSTFRYSKEYGTSYTYGSALTDFFTHLRNNGMIPPRDIGYPIIDIYMGSIGLLHGYCSTSRLDAYCMQNNTSASLSRIMHIVVTYDSSTGTVSTTEFSRATIKSGSYVMDDLTNTTLSNNYTVWAIIRY